MGDRERRETERERNREIQINRGGHRDRVKEREK